MDVVHHIGVTADTTTRAELRRIGISVDEGFSVFDVAESAANWSEVEAWVRRRRPSDVVRTTFTADEVDAARWLGLQADLHRGFPQPRDGEFGYLEATYDTSDYCRSCGIGLRQKAPFQMKGDPNMGRRAILQMHWVYDEYFAKPPVWETVFKPLGIDAHTVTKPSGVVLEHVVQLVIDEIVPIDVAGLGPPTGEELVCRACGRWKYAPVVRGPLPAPVVEPRGHLARSAEWFGSGASAHNEVLASRSLAAAIREAGIRGVSLVPATRTS